MDFRALGTNCTIKFRLDDETKALQFGADALDWIGKFEAKFSRFRADSIISRINTAAGREWTQIDPETEKMLDLADGIFKLTKGILDPTMLPLMQVWDWKVVHDRLPEPASVARALALTGWQKVQRAPGRIFLPEVGMGLDFGGFGKEFAVDMLAGVAKRHGIKDVLIDLGRDVLARGGNGSHPFWHVGLEDGSNPGVCWGGVGVTDRAVCSSGNYARQFTHHGITYGHILDPRTGWPVQNGTKAVTVIAKSCLDAGIYSTAVFVLGSVAGLALASRAPGVAVCIQSDQGIDGTRNFGRWLVQSA
jgi:thiamine biosynthesis lipoprotein